MVDLGQLLNFYGQSRFLPPHGIDSSRDGGYLILHQPDLSGAVKVLQKYDLEEPQAGQHDRDQNHHALKKLQRDPPHGFTSGSSR